MTYKRPALVQTEQRAAMATTERRQNYRFAEGVALVSKLRRVSFRPSCAMRARLFLPRSPRGPQAATTTAQRATCRLVCRMTGRRGGHRAAQGRCEALEFKLALARE